MAQLDNVLEAVENVDKAIGNMAKVLRENIPVFGVDVASGVDDNIARMEKLVVIRAALTQLYAPTDNEVSNPDENLEPGTDPVPSEDLTDPIPMTGDVRDE